MCRCSQLACLGVGLWFIAVWQLQTLQGTIEALPLPVYDGIVPCKQQMDWHDAQKMGTGACIIRDSDSEIAHSYDMLRYIVTTSKGDMDKPTGKHEDFTGEACL